MGMVTLECPYCESKQDIEMIYYMNKNDEGRFLKDMCGSCDEIFGFDLITRTTAETYRLR